MTLRTLFLEASGWAKSHSTTDSPFRRVAMPGRTAQAVRLAFVENGVSTKRPSSRRTARN